VQYLSHISYFIFYSQTQKPYDIYDDADNLRRVSNGRTFHPQSRQTNVIQFQYDNPTFKQDENI